MEIKPKKIDVSPISEKLVESAKIIIPQLILPEITELNEENPLKEIITNETPKIVNLLQSIKILLEHCDQIDGLEELENKLTQLGIRFNTDPKLYQKSDFWLLVCILYRSLIHLYLANPEDIIVTNWLDPHSDDYIPSEKLVAETIESLSGDLSQEILDRILAVADLAAEIATKQDTLTAGANIQINGTTISATDTIYDDTALSGRVTTIENKIPAEASSSNQLADKEFVHDLIATNASNFRGDWANWTSVPTDPLYYPEDYTGNKKPNNNDYLIIQNATDYDPSNTGIWRFVYKGDWDILGKSGWEPQYRVELAFTLELLNAINSGITSLKVSNYDNYRLEIDDLFPLIAAGL